MKKVKTSKVAPKSEMLSTIQANTVKQMIINSMAGIFEGKKSSPDDAFFKAANDIADRIIHATQMSLIQSNVFDKVVKNNKPLKAKKSK